MLPNPIRHGIPDERQLCAVYRIAAGVAAVFFDSGSLQRLAIEKSTRTTHRNIHASLFLEKHNDPTEHECIIQAGKQNGICIYIS